MGVGLFFFSFFLFGLDSFVDFLSTRSVQYWLDSQLSGRACTELSVSRQHTAMMVSTCRPLNLCPGYVGSRGSACTFLFVANLR